MVKTAGKKYGSVEQKRGIFSLTRTGINFLAQENQRRLNGMVY